MVDRVVDKRTVIVDDVINTGGTAGAAIQLLRQVGAEVMGFVVVLTEGHDWKKLLQTGRVRVPAGQALSDKDQLSMN